MPGGQAPQFLVSGGKQAVSGILVAVAPFREHLGESGIVGRHAAIQCSLIHELF
jgi:hypothetical protein